MTEPLKRTPFHDFHVERNARMVDFTGWSMPLLYTSIIEEHHQVRRAAGMFDVSHMGRVRCRGIDAARFLDRVCTRRIEDMVDGQARYGLICNEAGGCLDDVLVYRFGPEEYLVVCNATNRVTILAHFEAIRGDLRLRLEDETERTAMVALQGPDVLPLLGEFSSEITALKRYRFMVINVLFSKIMVSRTGYTGEDGVEVILSASLATRAIDMLLNRDSDRVKPIGLGARDSLRLEAGMALWGHEIDASIDPLAAGLDFAVALDKDKPFVGRDALRAIAEKGPPRRLVGLELEGRRAARHLMTVHRNGSPVGVVTSGCLSPTLDRSIAMAHVEATHAEPGTEVSLDLGRRTVDARVTALPFYRRS